MSQCTRIEALARLPWRCVPAAWAAPIGVAGGGTLLAGRRQAGGEFPLALTVGEMKFLDEKIYAGIEGDVSERQALHDALTGLPHPGPL